MTTSKKPFSIREGFAAPRPVQIKELDKETVARVGRVMGELLPNRMICEIWAKQFFAFSREEFRERGNFSVTLSRGSLEITSSGHDWLEKVPSRLCEKKGGWRVAFDFCEFVIGKQDEFIAEAERHERERQLKDAKSCEAKKRKNSHSDAEIDELTRDMVKGMEEQLRSILPNARNQRAALISGVNETLEQMNVGYRLREQTGRFDPIYSPAESEAVDSAVASPLPAVQRHMEKALKLFSDREKPDYANTVKESVSAVESLVKEWTGKEFKSGMAQLAKDGILPNDHAPKGKPFLPEAVSNIWGYANKTSRHGLKSGESPPDADTARFILVICAAFVNYMTTRRKKAE